MSAIRVVFSWALALPSGVLPSEKLCDKTCIPAWLDLSINTGARLGA
jgi:hypothetical protein